MLEDKSDLFRNSSVALVAGIPNIGGPLSFFLDKILPSQIEMQYNAFILSLCQEVDNLQIKVDESIIQSAEFISLFNRMIDIAVCEYSEKKKTIIRNILLSAISSYDRMNYNEYFEYLVSKLTIDEIRWLYFADEFARRNGVGAYSYLVQHKMHIQYQHITHVTTKLVRYRLLDGNRISNLGKMFIQFINSPISVFSELEEK